MADWRPTNAGPDTLRKLYHWVHAQLRRVGELIGDEGGGGDPGHFHDHDNLLNVTPDQHHPQLHTLDSHTNVVIIDPVIEDALVFDGANWINGEGQHQLSEANPTGLISGGELNIGPGANDIEVIAGLGVKIDSYTNPDQRPQVLGIEWPQINEAITAAPSVAGSYVHFTIYDTGQAQQPIGGRPVNLGALRQYAEPPTEPTRRDEIYLGLAVHNGTGWGEISSPIVINNAAHTLAEFLKRVAGPTFVIDGGEVSEAPAFTIDQSAGTVWEHNRNWHVNKKDPHREAIPATTGLQWKYVNRDFTDVSALTDTVDEDQWDDNGTVSTVPGGVNVATVQRLYQDPRDNYWVLWGQHLYDNAQEAAASVNARTEVPELLRAAVLLAYIVVEKGQNDWDDDEAFLVYPEEGGGAGGGGVPITNYLGLADTPGSYVGDARKVPEVDDSESVLQHDYRTKLLNYVQGTTYYPQETVFQDGWLMSANTITDDYPAPQPVGDPIYTLPEAPLWAEFSDTSVIYSGHLYTFTKAGYVRSLRVWVPELTATTNYRFVVVGNPNSSNPTYTVYDEPLLTEDGWTILDAFTTLVVPGSELLVYIDALNSGSSVSPGGTPADWIYTGTDNINGPTAGNWNTNQQNNLLRIHEETADAAIIDMTGVIPGSTFTFTDSTDPNTSVTYLAQSAETLVGGVYSWTVTVSSTGTNGAPTTGTRTLTEINVPVAASTKFVGIDSWWNPSTLPTWADIESFLQFDGVPQAVQGDEAYGIDISFQELITSPDWDIYGIPSSGGGGGGGGEDPTFAGAGTTGYVPDPVTEEGKFLKDDGTWDDAGGGSVPVYARKNLLINGNFEIWDKGTPLNDNALYGPNRWFVGGISQVSRGLVNTVGTQHTYRMAMVVTTTGYARQPIELPEAGQAGIFFAGQTFTLSGYINSNRDVSVAGFFADDAVTAGNIVADLPQTVVHTADTVYKRFEITFTVGATPNPTNLAYFIQLIQTGAGTAENMNVYGMQLEIGDTATDFEYRAIAEERNLCARYFILPNITDNLGRRYGQAGIGFMYGGGTSYPKMRVSPTVIQSGTPSYNQCSNLSTFANRDTLLTRVTSSGTGWYSYSGVVFQLDAEI